MGGSGNQQLPRKIFGYGATVLSIYFLIQYRAEVPIVATSLYFTLICITDTLKSKIPNLLNLSLLLFGLVYGAITNGWTGLSHSILGMLLGLVLLMIPYLMGGFGAGDVKALGALGSVTGPEALLYIFVYMAFWGGAMAVLHYIFNRDLIAQARNIYVKLSMATINIDTGSMTPTKTETLRFPYAAAIALGYFTYIVYGKFY